MRKSTNCIVQVTKKAQQRDTTLQIVASWAREYHRVTNGENWSWTRYAGGEHRRQPETVREWR